MNCIACQRRLLATETPEFPGFEIEAHYGWFDRSRYRGGEDSVWIARRPGPA